MPFLIFKTLFRVISILLKKEVKILWNFYPFGVLFVEAILLQNLLIMILSNKAKNNVTKISWILVFILGALYLNGQSFSYDNIELGSFDNADVLDVAQGFDFNDGIGAPVDSLSASILPESRVKVSWQYTFSASLQDFIIYKKQEKRSWEVYKNINAEDACLWKNPKLALQSFHFEDLNVQIGSKVEYRIIARFENGVKTEVSAPLKVYF